MFTNLADWLISLRNARAWATAFTLLMALLWLLWATRYERVEYRELYGELVETRQTPDPDSEIGIVRLPDGRQVKLVLPFREPLPPLGTQVPLSYERYENGEEIFFFNNGQWIADGGY